MRQNIRRVRSGVVYIAFLRQAYLANIQTYRVRLIIVSSRSYIGSSTAPQELILVGYIA